MFNHLKLSLTCLRIATAALLVGLHSPNLAATELLAQRADEFDYWADRCYELSGLEAIEACEKAIAINPNYTLGWYNRGVELGELERYSEAIDSYNKALALDPNSADAWYNRGVCLAKLERYSEAINSFEKAIDINRNYIRAWYNRAVVLEATEDYEEALESYEEVLRINPNFEDTRQRRDSLLQRLGR